MYLADFLKKVSKLSGDIKINEYPAVPTGYENNGADEMKKLVVVIRNGVQFGAAQFIDNGSWASGPVLTEVTTALGAYLDS